MGRPRKNTMSTVTTTPTANVEKSLIRKTIMTEDLDDVLIGKEFSFVPVGTPEEALARIGGDAEKFLKVLNAGIRSIERESFADSTEGWFKFDADGKKLSTESVSGESAGDPTAIAALINNFARVSTPNWANLKAAEKNGVRDKVRQILKSNPAMLEMLKASVGVASPEENAENDESEEKEA